MIQKEITTFIEGKHPDDYLFRSQKGMNPITTTQVYRILNDVADILYRNDIANKTKLKTFSYQHYKQIRDVANHQEIFNQSAPSITMSYIGISQNEINESLK